ncbi:hypothetical protein [Actinoplanes rectilineatus]|uniref:hypothetical protein n=1 Tax=Actinoplanes rectilineatus TaxID=113571 RepID=UPI0005F2931A|nr:hypothetical protein [Actinoplanes rectilineatus]
MRNSDLAARHARRILNQNPLDVPESQCSHRDDPGHDHEQCLETIASIHASVATRPNSSGGDLP